MTGRRYLLLGLCVVAFAAVDAATRIYRARTRPASAEGMTLLAEPFPLKAFAARDLDGQPVSPDAWRGRITLVNFWATWCTPCRVEMPALAGLQEKYRGDLQVVGILYDNVAADVVRKLTASLNVNYPIVPTSNDIEASFSEPPVLPMTYLIDRQGRIVGMQAGILDMDRIEREIRALQEKSSS